MDFQEQRYADVVVSRPTGRIDHSSAPEYEKGLAPLLAAPAGTHAALLLDFGGVEYISSVGLRVLMVAAKELKARKARIAIAGLQPVVREIFEISRFNQVIEVFPTPRSALAALSAPALAAFDAAQGGATAPGGTPR